MALTAQQRKRLPDRAFAYPAQRKYPVPTKAQAAKAGISEPQRQQTLNSAKSYAARRDTMGTSRHVNSVVRKRRSR
jgi:hypothetical protein